MPLDDLLNKPESWDVEPGFVDDEWEEFWAAAGWVGGFLKSGEFADLTAHLPATLSGSPSIEVVDLGYALQTDAASSERVVYTVPQKLDQLSAVTMWAFHRSFGHSGSWPGIVSMGSGSDCMLNRYIDSTRMEMRVDTTTAGNNAVRGDINHGTNIISFFGRWSSGVLQDIRVYDKQGLLLETASDSTPAGGVLDVLAGDTIEVSNHVGVGRYLTQDFFAGGIFDRVFSDEFCGQLACDPFGPLRMLDEVGVVVVPAVGGVTLPIFDNHYRSMRAA